jgi:DNA-directed RNA polymerase specialized sigma24 family protein
MSSQSVFCEEIEILIDHEPELPNFSERFARYQGLLYFLACRVLRGEACAIDAVANCWRRASASRQEFSSEGEFRAWLARILIDESLVILRESRGDFSSVATRYGFAA